MRLVAIAAILLGGFALLKADVTLAFIGDSIVNGSTDYEPIPPSGDTNFSIGHWVNLLSTNLIGVGGIGWTNHGVGSRTFALMVSNGDYLDALTSKPQYLVIHCGVNDVNLSVSWNTLVGHLNTIAQAAKNSNATVVVDEIFPWSNGTDAQNITVRSYNTNFSTWVQTNANAGKLLRTHDAMGQTRVSTGQLDDLLANYDKDGVHLTTNGYRNWGALIMTNYFDWIRPPSRGPRIRGLRLTAQ